MTTEIELSLELVSLPMGLQSRKPAEIIIQMYFHESVLSRIDTTGIDLPSDFSDVAIRGRIIINTQTLQQRCEFTLKGLVQVLPDGRTESTEENIEMTSEQLLKLEPFLTGHLTKMRFYPVDGTSVDLWENKNLSIVGKWENENFDPSKHTIPDFVGSEKASSQYKEAHG